jgi:hypothetical protein
MFAALSLGHAPYSKLNNSITLSADLRSDHSTFIDSHFIDTSSHTQNKPWILAYCNLRFTKIWSWETSLGHVVAVATTASSASLRVTEVDNALLHAVDDKLRNPWFCRLPPGWRPSAPHWYVSNVSIIFYAPCLFLHHLPTVSLHFVALLCIFRN